MLLLGKAVIARMLEKYALTLQSPALGDADRLPYMLDFFDVRFGVATG